MKQYLFIWSSSRIQFKNISCTYVIKWKKQIKEKNILIELKIFWKTLFTFKFDDNVHGWIQKMKWTKKRRTTNLHLYTSNKWMMMIFEMIQTNQIDYVCNIWWSPCCFAFMDVILYSEWMEHWKKEDTISL